MDGEVESTAWIDERREGERPCPVCGSRMYVERKGTVSIDVCADHGIWLDRGELEAVIRSARGRSRRRQRDAVKRARRDGKIKGAFFGWWSLFGD